MNRLHDSGWNQWMGAATMVVLLLPMAGVRVVRAEVTPAVAELRKMSTAIVQRVVKHLHGKNMPIEVRIGSFENEPEGSANTGGIFVTELKTAFSSIAKNTASTTVFGTYSSEVFKDGDDVNKVRVKVTVRLRDEASGRELAAFHPHEATLTNASNTAQLQGRTTILPKAGAIPAKNEHEPFIAGTQIKAFQDSPYAIEILKRPVNTNIQLSKVPPELVEGQPFVPLFKGEVVQVRVLNYSSREIGVSMKLDGVDQFALSRIRKPMIDHNGNVLRDMMTGNTLTEPRYRAFLVDPSKNGVPGETILTGWHINDTISEEFEQVALGNGVRSLFPELVNGPVGVITVGISDTHPKNFEAPMVRGTPGISPGSPPPLKSQPKSSSPPPAYSRSPRIPKGTAGSAPPPAQSRSPAPTRPDNSARRDQPSTGSQQVENGEFKNGKQFEYKVTGTSRIIDDPNTVITVRYHR